MVKNQVKIGAILSYIVIALNMISGILYTPFMIRRLGQSEYGIFSIVQSIIAYLTVMDMGFGNAIIIYTTRYINQKDEKKLNKLHGMFFTIFCIIGAIATIIGLIIFFNAQNLFGNSMTSDEVNKLKVMLMILTFNLAITFPLSIFGNIITAHEKFIINKTIQIIQIILQPLIMIPLLLLGYKAIAMTIVLTLVNVFCLSLNTYICIKHLHVKLKFNGFDKILLKEIFAYSFYIFLNELIDKANWTVDRFILGSICGTIVTAIYSIAGQINQLFMNFSIAISGVMLPKITKMEDNKASNDEFTKIFIKTGRIQYIILALILTGFIIFGQTFVNLWAGPGYETAYKIACILMIPLIVPLIQNVGLSILQAKNLYKYRTIIFFFIAIINTISSIFLAKYYGGVGAAIGTSGALILGQIIILNIYYHVKVGINMIEFWKNILKMSIPMIIVFLIGIGINRIVPDKSIIVYGGKILAYTLVYCASVYLFAMNKYEKDLIRRPINKILKRG